MDRETVLKYLQFERGLADRQYLLAKILFGAAPTILGEKPGTLLNFTVTDRPQQRIWTEVRQDFRQKIGAGWDVDFAELSNSPHNIVVLFYQRTTLVRRLEQPAVRQLLREFGYPVRAKLEGLLDNLRNRFQTSCPPEVGIFLGVPVADVQGFIVEQGGNYRLNGYWKVYHQPEQATQTFINYDRLKRVVVEFLIKEKSSI